MQGTKPDKGHRHLFHCPTPELCLWRPVQGPGNQNTLGKAQELATIARNKTFCEARFAGLSPWFAPVRGGVGGLHFGLMRRALSIFAPRSTPNKLLLTAVTLFARAVLRRGPQRWLQRSASMQFLTV
jgi:hypothetical protein